MIFLGRGYIIVITGCGPPTALLTIQLLSDYHVLCVLSLSRHDEYTTRCWPFFFPFIIIA